MKNILIIILTIFVQSNFALAQKHDHKTDQNHSKIKDLGANKFIPTEDLKIRMVKILDLMKELDKEKANSKKVQEYGEKISKVISDIFKTCKLEPAADTAIHPVLTEILKGTKDFKNSSYDKGHEKIHESLLNYEKLFSHEGWKHDK